MGDARLITPEQAAAFLGVTMGKLSHIVVGTGPPANAPPVLRLARVDGRPMVYLRDVLLLGEILNPLAPATVVPQS